MSEKGTEKEEKMLQLVNEYKELQGKIEALINKANKILLELESLDNNE